MSRISVVVEIVELSVSLLVLLFEDVVNIVSNKSLLKDIGVKKARFLFLLIVYLVYSRRRLKFVINI